MHALLGFGVPTVKPPKISNGTALTIYEAHKIALLMVKLWVNNL